VTDLRYATFDGHSWTPARTILTGRKIWWNISSRPPLLENGAIIIVVPAEETSTSLAHTGVAILTMLRGELQTGWISTHGPLPSAVSIAAIPSRGFALAFIGAVIRSHNASIDNSIVGANSTDGGRTWTDPYAIETLGNKRADDLRMLTVRGQAHLFWTVDATAAGDSAVLAHRVSTNGVVWHDDRSVRFARSINALDVVAFDDAITAIARDAHSDSLVVSAWTGTSPVALSYPALQDARFFPHLTAVGRDSLALLWGVERLHAYPLFPSLPVPALVTSRRAVQCR
jgi:hypothetical protein